MSATHHQSSKGPVAIATMAYPHLFSAHAKLVREGFPQSRQAEVDAMAARLEVLNAEYNAKGADEGAGTVPVPAPQGHNAAPPTPQTFEAIAAHISDLYDEAKNWLDGQPIETQAQADEVSRLKGMITEAEALAEKTRRAENEPFDTGKAEVQARYAPLISDTKSVRGKTVMAREACNRALTPWLKKLDDEREARAKALREEADKRAAEAAQAARSDNLATAEIAEEMFAQAKSTEREARNVELDRARVGGGEYRATILKDNWIAELVDGQAALRHLWQTRRADLEAFALRCATEDVRAGKRVVPGFKVWNDRRAA